MMVPEKKKKKEIGFVAEKKIKQCVCLETWGVESSSPPESLRNSKENVTGSLSKS